VSAPLQRLLPLLQAMLNRTLALDADADERRRPLRGSTIVVQVDDRPLELWLQFHADSVLLASTSDDTTCDLRISGSMADFLRALQQRDAGGGLKLHGNIDLARALEALLRDYRADLEEPLSRVIGDTAARQALLGARRARRLGGALRRKLLRDWVEYLVYERGVLLDPHGAQEFIDAVDVLRNRIEHLDKRVQAAEERRSK